MSRHVCVLEAGDACSRDALNGADKLELEVYSVSIDETWARIDAVELPSSVPKELYHREDESAHGYRLAFDPSIFDGGNISIEFFADDPNVDADDEDVSDYEHPQLA